MQRQHKSYPKQQYGLAITAGLAAGLYPLLYLYTANHTLLLSWSQFGFFLLVFILVPVCAILLIAFLTQTFTLPKNYYRKVVSVFNFAFFSSLLVYSTYGLKKKLLLGTIILAAILGCVLFKHLKKVIKFQFLLVIIGVFFLVPTVIDYAFYNSNWQAQPDAVLSTTFKHTPNIYVIQPDGYIGLSQVEVGNYKKDNTVFTAYLSANKFELYPNFRSNYSSTLSSNSAMFSMKHHYYNHNPNIGSELLRARDIIISDNSVLSILKNNGYKTSLILENSYLLASRPKMGYDFSSIKYKDFAMRSTGFEFKTPVLNDLKLQLSANTSGKHFYFIERIIPGHIATYESASKGSVLERESYLERLDAANVWLTQTVDLITQKDANALIIIVSDHGGFVGYDYSGQSSIKPINSENTFSMFSSLLAIKWPSHLDVEDVDVKTSVNLFRTLFSVLSEDKSLLDHLEPDASYLTVTKGAPLGIYEVINSDNKAVFKPLVNE